MIKDLGETKHKKKSREKIENGRKSKLKDRRGIGKRAGKRGHAKEVDQECYDKIRPNNILLQGGNAWKKHPDGKHRHYRGGGYLKDWGQEGK